MKIIAHRSGLVTCPEQTIASAREALRLGADMPVGEPDDAGLERILSFEPDGVLINDVRRLIKYRERD